jgi:carbon monoxide dehydrogenase subunit G
VQEGRARRDHRRAAERPPGHDVAVPGAGALAIRDTLWAIPAGIALGFAGGRIVDGIVGLVLTLVVLFALLALVWWIRGGRGWRIDAETEFDAPPEEVFALLDDPERTVDADPRLVATEVIAPGLQRYRMRVALRDVEVEMAAVAREPPKRLVDDVVRVSIGGKRVQAGTQRQTLTLTPLDGGTRVRLEVRGHAGTAAARFGIGVRHDTEARYARRVLRRLRDYASAPARSR